MQIQRCGWARMFHHRCFAAVPLLLPLLVLHACAPPQRFDVARVAVLTALTGEHTAAGQEVVDGARLAIEGWNAAGGVHGLRLELITSDAGAPETSRRLRSDPRLVLVIGGPGARGDTVRTTPGAPAMVLLERGAEAAVGQGIVSLAPSLEQVAEVAAAAVAFNYGPVTVAVVSSAGPEDVAAAAAFAQAAVGRGLRVRATYTLAPVETAYIQAAAAVRGAAPQVVYVTGRGYDAGALWAEIRARDSRIRLVLGPGVLDEGFVRTAGGFLEGVSALELTARPGDAPEARAFVEQFTARYGRPPTALAARAYDAAVLGLRAIAAATDGSAPSRAAVRVALARETELSGVLRSYALVEGVPVSWKLALFRLGADGSPVLIGEPEVR